MMDTPDGTLAESEWTPPARSSRGTTSDDDRGDAESAGPATSPARPDERVTATSDNGGNDHDQAEDDGRAHRGRRGAPREAQGGPCRAHREGDREARRGHVPHRVRDEHRDAGALRAAARLVPRSRGPGLVPGPLRPVRAKRGRRSAPKGRSCAEHTTYCVTGVRAKALHTRFTNRRESGRPRHGREGEGERPLAARRLLARAQRRQPLP